MPWINPDSVTDPEDRWEDEVLAIDGDVETFAVTRNLDAHAITPELIFSWPMQEVSGWRYKLGTSLDPLTTEWREDHWDAVEMDSVGFRFSPDHAEPADIYLYEFLIESPCSGPLAPLCGLFHTVAAFFEDVADNIEHIWLLGDYLSQPFYSIASTLHDMGNTCCEVSASLQETLELFEGGITWDELTELIQTHWPTLYNLINDPVGWFLVELTLAFDLEPYHTQSLEFLAKYVLEEYFPALYHFWLDPNKWLADTLEENFPLLYYLIVDPAGELLYLIAQAFDLEPYQAETPEMIVKTLFERYFPTLYHIWLDPDLWLKTWLSEWLGLEVEEIDAILSDPLAWLFDKAEAVFLDIADRLYSLGERVLRYFWEGVWQES